MPPRYLPRPALFIVGAIIVLAQFIPLPYVAIVPGPVLDVLNSAITINISGRSSNSETVTATKKEAPMNPLFSGKLFATTVMVSNPDSHMYAPELIVDWVRGDSAIQPRSAIYPTAVTRKAALAQGKVEMVSAEQSATLAAANFLAPINPSIASMLNSSSVHFATKETGGPSAGLAFAIALVTKVQDNQLLRGRTVAVTGTIDASGKVGPIGGIDQKLIGASRAGARIFLAPAENCLDISRTPSEWKSSGWKAQGMRVIPVSTLSQAVHLLVAANLENAPHC